MPGLANALFGPDLAGLRPWLLGLLPRCRCQSRTRPPSQQTANNWLRR